jgi:hypothetical protein
MVSLFVPQRQPSHEWLAREVPSVEIPSVILPREKITECPAMDMKGPFRVMIEGVLQRPLRVGSRRHQIHVVVNDVSNRILRIVGHLRSLYTNEKNRQETLRILQQSWSVGRRRVPPGKRRPRPRERANAGRSGTGYHGSESPRCRRGLSPSRGRTSQRS